jgi:hypothetical protein
MLQPSEVHQRHSATSGTGDDRAVFVRQLHWRSGADEFGEALVRSHHGQAIKFPRSGILHDMFGSWAQHHHIAWSDVATASVGECLAGARQDEERLLGDRMRVGRCLAARLDDFPTSVNDTPSASGSSKQAK